MPTYELFELEIIQKSHAEKIPVQWIEVDGQDGNFLIGARHSPLISLLKNPGRIVYLLKSGEKIIVNVQGGVIYVDEQKTTIVLD